MALDIKLPPDAEKIINDFIKSKVNDVGSAGVVLGLSGGLDSAVVAKLCADALGPENVTALMLPERSEKDSHFIDAKKYAEDIGIKYSSIDIEPLVNGFVQASTETKTDDLVMGNLKARIRAVLIYMTANSENKLVAGTSNKSELMIGYFTKYGDGASDIAPIGDLYKTQVRELAKNLGVHNGIIEKPPTAGLIPGQTDEKELGISYEKLDRVLLGYELQLPHESIAQTLDIPVEEIQRIKNISDRCRHKRKFTKIPKIGIKTVGLDLRE